MKLIPAIIRPTVFWACMRPVAGTVLAKIFAEILLKRFVAEQTDYNIPATFLKVPKLSFVHFIHTNAKSKPPSEVGFDFVA